jgi:O-antigen ligase
MRMTPVSASPVELSYAGLLSSDPRTASRADWLYAILLVGGLTGAGVLFAYATHSALYAYAFSYRVALLYVPVAGLLTLVLGYSRFPLAAALFYGLLPIAQAAHAHDFWAGELKTALTAEMVLALPLILMGFIGPPGNHPGSSRPLPPGLKAALAAVLVAAGISTMLAREPGWALVALLARFVLPLLVTLATARRLRNLEEYRVIWLGFVTATALICAFQYRRGVLGELQWYETLSQRFAGASQSFAIPMLYLVGGQLAAALIKARRGAPAQAVFWLLLVVGFGLLMWLGAARGPLVFFALLVLWWVPRVLRHAYRPGVLVMFVLAGLGGLYLIQYSLTRTMLDVRLIIERFEELLAEGPSRHNRVVVWNLATEYWKQSPVWGIGLNNWPVEATGYESAHSLLFGLLVDMGVLGVVVFAALFLNILMTARRSNLALPPDDWAFFQGCRAGWVTMLLCLTTNLPFTSGQPRNQIFAYTVYFFLLLVIVAYKRYPPVRAPALSAGMYSAGLYAAMQPASQFGRAPGPAALSTQESTPPGRG